MAEIEPMVGLAEATLAFVRRWREAFQVGHKDYLGDKPGANTDWLWVYVFGVSCDLAQKINAGDKASGPEHYWTLDATQSLNVIRQCATDLWASQGLIWNCDPQAQFKFGDDEHAVTIPDYERPKINISSHLKILETHAARLFEGAPITPAKPTHVIADNTRKPTTEQVREVFSRLDDYLYKHTEGVTQEDAERTYRAAFAAIKAAKLDTTPLQIVGWQDNFVHAMNAIMGHLWPLYNQRSKAPDERLRNDLKDQVGYARSYLDFNVGRETEEAEARSKIDRLKGDLLATIERHSVAIPPSLVSPTIVDESSPPTPVLPIKSGGSLGWSNEEMAADINRDYMAWEGAARKFTGGWTLSHDELYKPVKQLLIARFDLNYLEAQTLNCSMDTELMNLWDEFNTGSEASRQDVSKYAEERRREFDGAIADPSRSDEENSQWRAMRKAFNYFGPPEKQPTNEDHPPIAPQYGAVELSGDGKGATVWGRPKTLEGKQYEDIEWLIRQRRFMTNPEMKAHAGTIDRVRKMREADEDWCAAIRYPPLGRGRGPTGVGSYGIDPDAIDPQKENVE
jgi:hypothetical protein